LCELLAVDLYAEEFTKILRKKLPANQPDDIEYALQHALDEPVALEKVEGLVTAVRLNMRDLLISARQRGGKARLRLCAARTEDRQAG
jgi:hypothetical protein